MQSHSIINKMWIWIKNFIVGKQIIISDDCQEIYFLKNNCNFQSTKKFRMRNRNFKLKNLIKTILLVVLSALFFIAISIQF